MKKSSYNPTQNYCETAKNFQSVPSHTQYGAQHPEVDEKDYDANRAKTLYMCSDDYQMGTIQENQIYIATTDGQHDQIVNNEHVDAQGGLSGYFTDQATIEACKNGDNLDNTKYNEACQIAPRREGGPNGEGDAQYKPHVDCFDIDREALFNNYCTHDFNAAIAKSEANNHLGSGGGNQGYNPYISEMFDNGSLKYNPYGSYSDKSISKSEHNNPNILNNSVVPEDKADAIYSNAQVRSQDCVNNNTPHPSPEACNNGFDKNNAVTINQTTGNAIISNPQTAGELPPHQQSNSSNNGEIAGTLPEGNTVQPVNNNAIAGTTPDKAENIKLFDKNTKTNTEQDLAENVGKKAEDGINSATGIT